MTDDYYRFHPVDKAELIVPEGYQHQTYLKEFRKRSGKFAEFYLADKVNDEMYPRASQRLVPGMRLAVTTFGIDLLKEGKMVRISKCVKFIIEKGGVLTNAHGLGLAFEHCRELFEPGFSYYGLDVPDMLPHEQGEVRTGHRHPMISVPKSRTPMPVTFSHTLIERFGKHVRFLMFELV